MNDRVSLIRVPTDGQVSWGRLSLGSKIKLGGLDVGQNRSTVNSLLEGS